MCPMAKTPDWISSILSAQVTQVAQVAHKSDTEVPCVHLYRVELWIKRGYGGMNTFLYCYLKDIRRNSVVQSFPFLVMVVEEWRLVASVNGWTWDWREKERIFLQYITYCWLGCKGWTGTSSLGVARIAETRLQVQRQHLVAHPGSSSWNAKRLWSCDDDDDAYDDHHHHYNTNRDDA